MARRRRMSRNAIKEVFDNLPTGVCYFNQEGILLLANHIMDQLAFELMGHDLQIQAELLKTISGLPEGVFSTDDGKLWQFHIYEKAGLGIECLAEEITDLYQENQRLEEKNRELQEMEEAIREASRNVVAIAREEEILAMKMQIHREMGETVLAIRNYYLEGCPKDSRDLLITQLQKNVSMLKGEVGQQDESDPLEELLMTAKAVGAEICIEGQIPKEKDARRLLVSAMQECMTNVIRHASGNILYVVIREEIQGYIVEMTNNGLPPTAPIVEGGGLGSLRKKLQRDGCSMQIQSVPVYKVTITIPRKEKL